jgi:Fungal Zn(2)-Cys(6) binuclear cluster domain
VLMTGAAGSRTRTHGPSKTRRGVPKSRQGCLICRARHVKCDEERPYCQKCTTTGRACDYAAKSTDKALIFINVLPYPSANPRTLPGADRFERRALSYFQHRAASELGGDCLPDLWSKFILPISHSDDVIKHAVVALATMHEDFATRPLGLPTNSDYALKQYGMAVDGLLQQDLACRPDATDVALISCIIFASLEILRGHYHSSLTHIRSGQNILNEEQSNPRRTIRSIPRHLLVDILQRTETQARVISTDHALTMPQPASQRPTKPVIPRSFKSVQDAFYMLETMQTQIFQFFEHAALYLVQEGHVPEAFNDLEPELIQFEELFEGWQNALDRLYQNESASPKTDLTSNLPSILLMNILRTNIQTIFPTSRRRHGTECDFDTFVGDFESMVDWAEKYVKTNSTLLVTTAPMDTTFAPTPPSAARKIVPKPDPVIRPTFSMSTGIVPVLTMCGARCRDPRIRRKALHLLQTCNRREGWWDSTASAQVVATIIRVEEANAIRELGERCPLGHITDASQISVRARIVITGVKFGAGRSAEVGYRVGDISSGEEGQRSFKEAITW